MNFDNLYLTFTEYQQLGGVVDEMPFKILEYKAQKLIDKYTFNRLKDLNQQSQEVKLCVFELISILDKNNKILQNTDISSENTDGYSVSYNNISNENVSSFNVSIKNCIKDYLSMCKLDDGTPYLYCGVD